MLRKVVLYITVVMLLSAGCGTVKQDNSLVKESATTTAGSAAVSADTPKMDGITYSPAQNNQIVQAAKKVGIGFPFVPSLGLKGTTFKGAAGTENQQLLLEYSNMSIVESLKELSPETLAGGQAGEQKDLQLANRLRAQIYTFPNVSGNAAGSGANLFFRRNNINLAVKIGSLKTAHDTVLTEIGDSFYAVVGIFDQVNDEGNAKTVNFTNGWQTGEENDSKFLVVEAGALKRNPRQGVVLVREKTADGSDLSQKQYLTPAKHGAVRVDSFNSFNLTLLAEDGYEWIFNVFDGFR